MSKNPVNDDLDPSEDSENELNPDPSEDQLTVEEFLSEAANTNDDENSQDAPETPEQQLAKAQADLEEQRSEVLRIRAETENFKKRLQREKNDAVRFANEKLVKEVLPVYENLERALHAPEINIASLKEGVDMTLKQFKGVLEKIQVKTIEAIGEKFDPTQHEALSQIESHEHEEGTVVEVYSKGYLYNDRVLMPSKVVIAKKPADKDSTGS